MNAIYEVVNRYRKAEATARLIGEPNDEYRHAKRTLEETIRDARLALQEVQRIRKHICRFDSSDYCVTCGADGRA